MEDLTIEWDSDNKAVLSYLRDISMYGDKDTIKLVEGAYRPYMPDKDYPNWVVLMYMFDDILNRRKRFKKSKNWFSKKNLHTYAENFIFLDQILQEFHISPTVYYSELFWLSDIKKYPNYYDRKMGVHIPDIDGFNTVFSIISTFKSNFTKDIFIKYPEIDGWQQIYLKNHVIMNTSYLDKQLNLLKYRALSDNDKIILSFVKSFQDFTKDMPDNLEVNKLLVNLIWNTDSMLLNGSVQDWSGVFEETPEIDLVGAILGYHIDYSKIPDFLKKCLTVDGYKPKKKIWRIEDFAGNN